MITSTELTNERCIVIVMNECKMIEKLPENAENQQKQETPSYDTMI